MPVGKSTQDSGTHQCIDCEVTVISDIESDSVPVSEVVTAFNNIPNEFQSLTAWLTAAEIKYLKQLATNRFEFMYGDAHGMGYLSVMVYLLKFDDR